MGIKLIGRAARRLSSVGGDGGDAIFGDEDAEGIDSKVAKMGLSEEAERAMRIKLKAEEEARLKAEEEVNI